MGNIWGKTLQHPLPPPSRDNNAKSGHPIQETRSSAFSVMAINTDAVFEKSALGDREVSNPTNFQDTEKLLSTGTTEPSGQSNLKPSDSFSLNIRGSVRSLDPDQTEPSSPLRSGSIGHLATPPKSSSRISLGQLSAVPPGPQPSSYLWLAVLSCFCPAVPLNACALWYSNVVSVASLFIQKVSS